MLKTLSAAVIAVSVLAAPAAFAGTGSHAPRAHHHHHRVHVLHHHKIGMHKAALKHVAKHVAKDSRPSAKIVRKHG